MHLVTHLSNHPKIARFWVWWCSVPCFVQKEGPRKRQQIVILSGASEWIIQKKRLGAICVVHGVVSNVWNPVPSHGSTHGRTLASKIAICEIEAPFLMWNKLQIILLVVYYIESIYIYREREYIHHPYSAFAPAKWCPPSFVCCLITLINQFHRCTNTTVIGLI